MRLLAIALGLSLLGGFGGLSVAATLLLVPTSTRTWLVPALVSYAVGALLGVALLELLPQALVTLAPQPVFGTLLFGILTFFVLEKLARVARYCFLGTRVARKAPDGRSLAKYPVAYLLGPEECNNDSTNFWIFSGEGLKRLIHRTGWNILAYTTIGDTRNSTPADENHDERAFCVLESNAYSVSRQP